MIEEHTTSTILELSKGVIFLAIGGIIVLGYIGLKNKKKIVNIENLSTEEEKYETNKWVVEDAIKNNDIDKLKRLLDNKNITKHEDLSKMINDFLKKNIENN